MFLSLLLLHAPRERREGSAVEEGSLAHNPMSKGVVLVLLIGAICADAFGVVFAVAVAVFFCCWAVVVVVLVGLVIVLALVLGIEPYTQRPFFETFLHKASCKQVARDPLLNPVRD